MRIIRILNGDCKKSKHTPIVWMHLAIPLIGAIAMALYVSLSPSAYNVSNVLGYLQLVAIAFPMLIGVICSMSIEQESQAGNFQVLFISSNPKYLALLSKFLYLVIFGAGSVSLAVYCYVVGITVITHKSLFSWSFYLIAILILIGSFVFDYMFHLFLSLCFGKGASIGVGIAELLISAIFNTDLGDNIWVAFPCTWGIRFVTTWTKYASKSALQSVENMMADQTKVELNAGILICIIATVLCVVFTCIWFTHWEGKKYED
ncbi:MAG: lantibiotic immunity ABC transporter MutG family permease subunit [Velocimicrobium sp.]